MKAHSHNMDCNVVSKVDRGFCKGGRPAIGDREIKAFENLIGLAAVFGNDSSSSSYAFRDNSLNDLEQLLEQLLEMVQEKKQQQQQRAALNYIKHLMQELSGLAGRIETVMNWAESMMDRSTSHDHDD